MVGCPATALPVGYYTGSTALEKNHSQDEPPLVDTYTLLEPLFATPTKIRGVAVPEEPEDLSKVTQAIPILSELYPEVSEGSGM